MERIEGYETVQPMNAGERESIEPGGYICRIISAEERLSKTNKRMLVMYFDIAEGDKADFYKRRYEEDRNANTDITKIVNWKGVYRQMLEGEKAINFLKGLMNTLKDSNPGFEWDWDERKLAGLKFGGLFGREEYEKQDGSGTAMTTKLRYIRTVDFIVDRDYEVPADRLLPKTENPFATNTNPFGNTADNEDTLPF